MNAPSPCCLVLPAGCWSCAGLRRRLRDQELWQLWPCHSGQVRADPGYHHHRHQRGDVLFRAAGMLRHHPGVQVRPQLCTLCLVFVSPSTPTFILVSCRCFASIVLDLSFCHIPRFLCVQFFVIIFVIFAAEVAALVFSIIYQGKVSYRLAQWFHIGYGGSLQCIVFFLSVQIKSGLELSMNEVFSKYGGQESEPVDALQTQVGVTF